MSKEAVGKRLKEFRKKYKLTQNEMAVQSNISQSTLTRIEVGALYPSFEYLDFLTKNYQLNFEWLVSGKGKMCATKDNRDIYKWVPVDIKPEFLETMDIMQRLPQILYAMMEYGERLKRDYADKIKATKLSRKGEEWNVS